MATIVKISYFDQQFYLPTDFSSLSALTVAFMKAAGIATSKKLIAFSILDSTTGKRRTIENDEHFQALKQISDSFEGESYGRIHLQVLGAENHSLLLEKSISSDTEMIEKHDEEEEEIPLSKKSDKRRKKEKIKKLVAKELQKQIPEIIEITKQLVLSSFNHAPPQNTTASAPPTQQQKQSSGVVHPRVTCDGCSVNPIAGIRYKCIQCADYDLCEKCEDNGVHSHHAFLKIRKPELAPKMLVSVENDATAQSFINNLASHATSDALHKVIDINLDDVLGCFGHRRQQRQQEQQKPQESPAEQPQEKPAQSAESQQEEQIRSMYDAIASVLGGNPLQYVDICDSLNGFPQEQIIDFILQGNLHVPSKPVPAATEPSAPVVVTEPANSQPSATNTPSSDSTPQPDINNGQDKDNEIAICKMIASILEETEESYEKYIDLVRENALKPIDEVLFLAMNMPSSNAPQEPKKAPEVVPPQEPSQSSEDNEKIEDKIPVGLKKKAEQIAEIMGGSFQDYLDAILNLPYKSSVGQIVENLLGKFMEGIPQKQPESAADEKKKETVVEKKEKVLRKKFSLLVEKKAKEVSEVLGGEAEAYYGVTDTYCLSSINELVEIILNNPDVVEQFSSYKSQ